MFLRHNIILYQFVAFFSPDPGKIKILNFMYVGFFIIFIMQNTELGTPLLGLIGSSITLSKEREVILTRKKPRQKPSV